MPFFFFPAVSAQRPVSGHKIVIDAGHGGTDSGSTECPALPEKTTNLRVAALLQTKLEEAGAIRAYPIKVLPDGSMVPRPDPGIPRENPSFSA